MQLAASPLQLPLEVPFEGTTARRPLLCHLQAAIVKVGPDALVVILPTSQAVNMTDNCHLHREESAIFHEDNPVGEGPGSRKASVQRYLEKRKDRCKSKRKVATSTSASMDMYLNHQIGNLAQNEHSNRSNACSSPQIRPPTNPTRCGSVENNIVKHADGGVVGLFIVPLWILLLYCEACVAFSVWPMGASNRSCGV
ncbi:hypothetical protein ACSBR2_032027 [Camellia fascicularis]